MSAGSSSRAFAFLKQIFTSGTATQKFVALSLLVGVITGFASYLFNELLSFLSEYLLHFDSHGVPKRSYALFFIPALGGLIIGPMVTKWAKEAKGHGVPEVMFAVARREGKIRPRVAVVKAIASCICIGSGGSAGREGPIVQIGSAFGSAVGQLFNMSGRVTKMLVACGAAAGIAATFGTPIAGVLFSLEVILQKFSANSFSMVVISAVTASAVARLTLGESFFFTIPKYDLNSVWELGLYALLGVIGAVWAKIFTTVLYAFEDFFDEKVNVPDWTKPAIGGLLLGVLGFLIPEVLSTGHHITEVALWGKLSFGALLLFTVAKLFATSFTLGSGGSGGIFSPSLFMGAMLGGCIGTLYAKIFPGLGILPGAYALAGMGAVFAGATRAPITAVLVVFEMTNDYKIILPMMTAVVSATLISYAFGEETIYTKKLLRRGIRLGEDESKNILSTITVAQVMTKNVDTLSENIKLKEIIGYFHKNVHNGFVVVNDAGELSGLITYPELKSTLPLLAELGDVLTAKEIMRTSPPTASLEETLDLISERLRFKDIDRLPVVDEANHLKVIGIISRHDILATYASASEGREKAF